MIPSLVEIALRALLVAVAVWAGLRLLGVRDVLAQKAAWGLVLAAAILMPLLLPLAMRWQIAPSRITLALPADLGRRAMDAANAAVNVALKNSPEQPAATQIVASQTQLAPALTAPVETRPFPRSAAAKIPSARMAPSASTSGFSASRSTIEIAPPMERVHAAAAAPRPLLPTLETLAVAVYMAICGVFLLRLLYGLTTAVSLWLDAEPIDAATAAAIAGGAAGLRLRSSRAVASPVTIGSGVILPASYDEWDAEKLRVVLAHERSHIRQGDFYLQLAAGVYSALFWFSPLGWWLKRKLSDLGEALSDRAGLEQAGSRSSYAQLLLEFAALPRPTLIGVAMARSSSLSHRIERLLDDSRFRQAFSVSPRRALAAALLVPAAIFAATALIRVEAAAGTASQTPSQTPSQTAGRTATGDPRPAQAAAETPLPSLQAAPAPVAQPEPSAQPESTAPVDKASQVEQAFYGYAPLARLAPTAPLVIARQPLRALAPMAPVLLWAQAVAPQQPAPATAPRPPLGGEGRGLTVGRGETLTIVNDAKANAWLARQDSRASFVRQYLRGSGNAFAFAFRSGDEDSYALVTNPAGGVRWSGDWQDGRRRELEKAGKVANGAKFLWFEHDGKSYIIDDPAIVSSIEAMYKPMDELGRKQEELGKQQEELGKQQEELGRKQEQASVPAPDVSREIAELNAAVAKLQSKKGGTLTQEDLGDLQSKIGDLQGKIGDIEGKIGEEQGRLGEEQGKLGEQQGKLGEEQGRLGEQEGRLAEEADRKVRVIIDQSLKDNKAKLVE